MSDAISRTHFPPTPSESAPLWLGVLGGPAVWAIQLLTIYALAPWACSHNKHFVIWILDAVYILLVIGGGAACLPYLARHRQSSEEDDRTHFLALYGLLHCALFLTVVIATTIATCMLDPCAT